MLPHPHPHRTARAADLVLAHPLAQSFSYRAVELLLAVGRGDDDLHPADADRLLNVALKAVVTAEVVAGREARV